MATNPDINEIAQNSPNDIRLSTWEYHDMVDALLDDRLSAKGLMTMKKLHLANSMNIIATPILYFAPAWFANRWFAGFVNRGIGQSRFNFIGMMMFYPIFLYYGFTRPLARKLYTDILADNGEDGEYVRSSLAFKRPGLWKKISTQLEDKGFDFPEMLNSSVTTQFEIPTSFSATRAI